ncbi:MAG: hypothetical protein KC414_02370 [Romboutsia sp.]|nr:hypothetical protein [Romboutsia sp.]
MEIQLRIMQILMLVISLFVLYYTYIYYKSLKEEWNNKQNEISDIKIKIAELKKENTTLERNMTELTNYIKVNCNKIESLVKSNDVSLDRINTLTEKHKNNNIKIHTLESKL